MVFFHRSTPLLSRAHNARQEQDDEEEEDEDDRLLLAAELDKDENRLVRWDRLRSRQAWLRWKLVPYYLLALLIATLATLMYIYHKQITTWLRPAADWMQALPAGWLIPIGVMVVQSFPPLFGQEIVAVLVGIVWGLGPGFGIVCAGTFLGECANFVVFRYLLRGTAEKAERKDMAYACLALTIRDGGFWLCLAARYSIVPGHLLTAIMSTCGMGFWSFAWGTFFSLPKQLVTVYLGVALEQENPDLKTKIGNYCVVGATLLFTVASGWWIWHKMKLARPTVLRERRRRLKMLEHGGTDAVGKVDVVEMDRLTASSSSKGGRGMSDRVEQGLGGGPGVASASRESLEWEVPLAAGRANSFDDNGGFDRSRRQPQPSGPNGLYLDPYRTTPSPLPHPSAATSAPTRAGGAVSAQQPFAYPEPRLNDRYAAGLNDDTDEGLLQSQQLAAVASLDADVDGRRRRAAAPPGSTARVDQQHGSNGVGNGPRRLEEPSETSTFHSAHTSLAADVAGQSRPPPFESGPTPMTGALSSSSSSIVGPSDRPPKTSAAGSTVAGRREDSTAVPAYSFVSGKGGRF